MSTQVTEEWQYRAFRKLAVQGAAGIGTHLAQPGGMTIEERLTRPAEILESRFLNRDGATFLQERFEQTTIVELYEWFVDRRGGDRGRRFLREAPLSPPWCRPRGLTGMGAYSPTFLPDLAS